MVNEKNRTPGEREVMTFREILERGTEIPTASYLVDSLLQGDRYLGNPMWTKTTLTYAPEGVFVNDNSGSNIGESLNDNRTKEGSRQIKYGFKTGRFYSFGEFESHPLVEGIFGESSRKLSTLAKEKLEGTEFISDKLCGGDSFLNCYDHYPGKIVTFPAILGSFKNWPDQREYLMVGENEVDRDGEIYLIKDEQALAKEEEKRKEIERALEGFSVVPLFNNLEELTKAMDQAGVVPWFTFKENARKRHKLMEKYGRGA